MILTCSVKYRDIISIHIRNIDPKWKQNCVTDTSFTLIIDNHKHNCVHDCPPIVQKSLRSCTQLVISCNNSSLSYALGMFIEHYQMCSLAIWRMFF